MEKPFVVALAAIALVVAATSATAVIDVYYSGVLGSQAASLYQNATYSCCNHENWAFNSSDTVNGPLVQVGLRRSNGSHYAIVERRGNAKWGPTPGDYLGWARCWNLSGGAISLSCRVDRN